MRITRLYLIRTKLYLYDNWLMIIRIYLLFLHQFFLCNIVQCTEMSSLPMFLLNKNQAEK